MGSIHHSSFINHNWQCALAMPGDFFNARPQSLFPSRNSDARSVMLRIPLSQCYALGRIFPEYADGTLTAYMVFTNRTRRYLLPWAQIHGSYISVVLLSVRSSPSGFQGASLMSLKSLMSLFSSRLHAGTASANPSSSGKETA